MRYIIVLWGLPLGLFWGWFFLSANDINFGSIYLSRALHELVFEVYGNMLGIDPATIPWLLAQAFALDTLLILAIWAFRRRRDIRDWVSRRWGSQAGQPAAVTGADPAPLEG